MLPHLHPRGKKKAAHTEICTGDLSGKHEYTQSGISTQKLTKRATMSADRKGEVVFCGRPVGSYTHPNPPFWHWGTANRPKELKPSSRSPPPALPPPAWGRMCERIECARCFIPRTFSALLLRLLMPVAATAIANAVVVSSAVTAALLQQDGERRAVVAGAAEKEAQTCGSPTATSHHYAAAIKQAAGANWKCYNEHVDQSTLAGECRKNHAHLQDSYNPLIVHMCPAIKDRLVEPYPA